MRRFGWILFFSMAVGACAPGPRRLVGLDQESERVGKTGARETQSLGAVLARLVEAEGYTLHLAPGWDGEPISATDSLGGLRGRVGAALAAFRYYAVFDDEGRTVTVRVLERCRESGGEAERVDFTDTSPVIRKSALREALAVAEIPAEFSEHASVLYQGCAPEGAAADPAQVEVVPPGLDGVPGLTLKDLQKDGGTPTSGADPSQVELVPPGHE